MSRHLRQELLVEKLERALENGGTSNDRIKALHLRLAARQHRDANLFRSSRNTCENVRPT